MYGKYPVVACRYQRSGSWGMKLVEKRLNFGLYDRYIVHIKEMASLIQETALNRPTIALQFRYLIRLCEQAKLKYKKSDLVSSR
jgi:hypothetical protein